MTLHEKSRPATHRTAPEEKDRRPDSTIRAPFSATLSAAIDKAHAHADRARELGWPAIADVFEACAADLAGLIPPGEREP